VERARRIEDVDDLMVALPEVSTDDMLAGYLTGTLGVSTFRGSEMDVLARYAGAANAAAADAIVRITADCPLLSPAVSTAVVRDFRAHASRCDYVSNTLTRTFPRGLDTEIVSAEALHAAHQEATRASDREHVTAFVWRQPDRFRLREVRDDQDRSSHRWTVDTREDFTLVARVYDELASVRPAFEYEDVLACLARHPDWSAINRHIVQKQVEG
jgi:spore coat polysaccharide biosynthesis protein SpsF